MKRLEGLAQAAVGFDARRGDQVVMENVSFSSNVPEMKPSAMDRVTERAQTLLHAQPGLIRTIVMGMCGLLVVLLVLKPVAREVSAILKEPVLWTAPARHDSGHEVSGVAAAGLNAGATTPPIKSGIFEDIAGHIRREPVQGKRLLEAWLAPEEGV
jgi:flagellar M-ring protein FliF